MIVYHGTIEIVKSPDVLHSFSPLDFGKGFYVTTVKEQAEKWARRKADLYNKPSGVVNLYQMKEDAWFDKITWLPEEPAVLVQD